MNIKNSLIKYFNHIKSKREIKMFPPDERPYILDRLMQARQEEDVNKRRGMLLDALKEMDNDVDMKAEAQRKTIDERHWSELEALQERILAPSMYFSSPRIDYQILEEKARAKQIIREKKESVAIEVDAIDAKLSHLPCISSRDRISIYFMLVLSFVANFFFFQAMLGDFVSGSTLVSICAVICLSALLVIAEIVGPKFLFSAINEKYAVNVAKCSAVIGGICLIVGIVTLFLGRGELSNAISPSVTDGFIK